MRGMPPSPSHRSMSRTAAEATRGKLGWVPRVAWRGRSTGNLTTRSRRGEPMPTAVIVDAVRTAVGRRNGQLKDWHPVDLAAETLKALVARNDLDPALVDDVIMG